ncbi:MULTISPECIES: hypothetical protein [Thermomonosporaceae]|uniref:hypothetical protein n=1 Tax=Thermomonosporaceae TaxID=2012 RepID=UPI00255AAB43|nr:MULTISPECIES: hypothetical protein [Thermomonosporaceae]MDL4770922.1 hypothetical protein [Actinomadura xylanilytica]
MRYEEIRGEIAAGTAAGTLPGWARRVLADVAAGRSRIAAVRHPLGFLCLPVERSGEFGVCLHLWSPEVRPAPPTTSELHCHSWELLSFVLYGTVRNVRVRVDDAGPGGDPTHRVFEVVSRDDVDELRATGRGVRYTSCGSAAHRTGESYALPAGIFHSTLIEGGRDAATVALGRRTPGGGDLSLGPLGTPGHRVRRSRCDPGDTARAALRAARLITAEHGPAPSHRQSATGESR